MDWLNSPELQGLAALVGVAEFAFLVWGNFKSAGGASQAAQAAKELPRPTPPEHTFRLRIAGILVLLACGWLAYSLPWAVLAFALGFSPAGIVFNSIFLILGSLPPLGSLLTRSVYVGGFLGGGLPLGLLALFWSLGNPEMQSVASPFAYFLVSLVIGGLVGTITGPATLRLVEALRLPIPFQ